MLIWRLVKRQIATLQELETHWSLDDVFRMNAVLDMSDYIEKKESEKRDNT